jgi:hypothetical protein
MLRKNQRSGTWRRAAYRDRPGKAGFEDISSHSAPPATLVPAR